MSTPYRTMFAVEILTVRRVNYTSGPALKFGTARIVMPGWPDEWFAERGDALDFKREFLECHVAEARVCEFNVFRDNRLARTDADIAALKEWEIAHDANEFPGSLRTRTA